MISVFTFICETIYPVVKKKKNDVVIFYSTPNDVVHTNKNEKKNSVLFRLDYSYLHDFNQNLT